MRLKLKCLIKPRSARRALLPGVGAALVHEQTNGGRPLFLVGKFIIKGICISPVFVDL